MAVTRYQLAVNHLNRNIVEFREDANGGLVILDFYLNRNIVEFREVLDLR